MIQNSSNLFLCQHIIWGLWWRLPIFSSSQVTWLWTLSCPRDESQLMCYGTRYLNYFQTTAFYFLWCPLYFCTYSLTREKWRLTVLYWTWSRSKLTWQFQGYLLIQHNLATMVTTVPCSLHHCLFSVLWRNMKISIQMTDLYLSQLIIKYYL